MQVCYCDICDTILKEKKHIIVIFEDSAFKDNYTGDFAKKKDTYEICDSCLKVIKDAFEYKKYKSKELTSMIDKIYKIKKKIRRRKR